MIAHASCSWCCGDLRPVETPIGRRMVCTHCGRLAPEEKASLARLSEYEAWHLERLRRSGGVQALRREVRSGPGANPGR